HEIDVLGVGNGSEAVEGRPTRRGRGERAVDHRIREIRRALGDNASEPVYIETVPSVGYRFRAQVHA
ncbi:MAG: winged helix-turn-helix domain-containing protein, partial [Actinomyces dentalis]